LAGRAFGIADVRSVVIIRPTTDDDDDDDDELTYPLQSDGRVITICFRAPGQF